MQSSDDPTDVGFDEVVPGPADVSVRLVVDVAYVSNGVPPEGIVEFLRRGVERAISCGLLSGDLPSTVDEYAVSVELVAGAMPQVVERGGHGA